MSKLINLVAGPCAGKTTMAALIFAEMKIQGYNVEYVSEYAKQLVWLKEFELLNNQHHVSLYQFKLFDAMKDAVEYIVTDGSLLHGLYYNRSNKDNVSNIEKTEQFILKCFGNFNNINIFLDRIDNPYMPEGRLQSFKEALEVDKELENILQEFNIPYTKFVAKQEITKSIVGHIINETK